MTTATEHRIARLREQVADAERLMAINYGTPLFAVYLAKRGKAQRQLRQMEAS